MHTFQQIKPNPQQQEDDSPRADKKPEDKDLIVGLHTELKAQVKEKIKVQYPGD